jgi:hypothetical protein
MKNAVHLSVVLTIGLSACSGSGPVPIGQDTFMLSNTGAWSWSSGSTLKADLYREANEFCRHRGQHVMPVNSISNNANFSQFAHSEIQFRCLAEGDPDLSRPTMRHVPDVTIETKQ